MRVCWRRFDVFKIYSRCSTFRINPQDLRQSLFWLCKIKMCSSVQTNSSGAPSAFSFRDQSHRHFTDENRRTWWMMQERWSSSLFNLFLSFFLSFFLSLVLPPSLQGWSSLCSCWGATWSRSAGRTRSYSAEEWPSLVNWASPMSSCQVSRWPEPQHLSDPTFRASHSCSQKKSCCITEEDSHLLASIQRELTKLSYFDIHVIIDLLNCVMSCECRGCECFPHVVWALWCDRLWSFLTYENETCKYTNNNNNKSVSAAETVIWINITDSHTFH